MILKVDDAEFATILAALRYYQSRGLGDPMNRPIDIHHIATNSGEVMSSLDDEWIDELCEAMNTGGRGHTVTVTVEGGLVQGVSDIPKGLKVLVKDYDTEGEEEVCESEWTYDDEQYAIEWQKRREQEHVHSE